MPETTIIDAHVHLWDPAAIRIPWLDGVDLLNRPLGLREYDDQTWGINVVAIVYVQVDAVPEDGLREIHWVVEHAREDRHMAGIVAWAPLEHGAGVRPYLAELVAISPKVKGVRRLIQSEPDPTFCLQPHFVRGVQLLPEYGLSFDLGITHHQLTQTIALVRQCRETQFILDHLGKPDIAGHVPEPWRRELSELAELPNVMCKISGVVTAADHAGWTDEELAPYVAHALAVFGEDRVVFGSDWPVCLLASSYLRWVDTLDALTAQLAPLAREKLWRENACRFYRLPEYGDDASSEQSDQAST
ncbi:MAG: amidohydrolase family protein [Herpetosiphonaceae bacterium]|nr:amidohydrolase family protein [Herpetosiphonaceae bacterium]